MKENSEEMVYLPSGRLGNMLALSLELKQWNTAKLIILNNLTNISKISYEFGGENPKSAIDHIISMISYIKEEHKKDLHDILLMLQSRNREIITRKHIKTGF